MADINNLVKLLNTPSADNERLHSLITTFFLDTDNENDTDTDSDPECLDDDTDMPMDYDADYGKDDDLDGDEDVDDPAMDGDRSTDGVHRVDNDDEYTKATRFRYTFSQFPFHSTQ